MTILEKLNSYASVWIIVTFSANLLVSVSLFQGSNFLLKEIPIIRSILHTGTQSSPAVEELLSADKAGEPIVVEAVFEVPLRESPPKAQGFFPLKKGAKIGDVRPNSEWIIVDSVKVQKLTGDDTWIRIANRNEVEKVLGKYTANIDELKAQLDKLKNNSGSVKISHGWAYLGDNFTPDK